MLLQCHHAVRVQQLRLGYLEVRASGGPVQHSHRLHDVLLDRTRVLSAQRLLLYDDDGMRVQ